jgi:hypothetical protein
MPPENGVLEHKAELKGTSSVRAVAWHPSEPDTALSVEKAKLLLWRLGGAGAEVIGAHNIQAVKTQWLSRSLAWSVGSQQCA